MKKIIIILIGLVLLSSCKAKRNAAKTHTNTRSVKDRSYTKVTPKKNVKTHKIVKKHKIEVNAKSANIELIENLYSNQPNLNNVKIEYIKKYNTLAINEMREYKIPASITLAQGLLESRYGQSELTLKSKNHFGIKCHKWKGKKVYHDDDSKGECFRKYDYDANSYRDHSLFLVNSYRYKKLFTYDADDYKSWAKGLRKAGYATDSRYPKKLINLIEEYKLYAFDKLVLGDKIKIKKKKIKKKNKSFHIVEVGETLYSISGKYYVSVNDIKRYNRLKSNEISVGQKLLLKGNSTKSLHKSVKKHVVVKGDTMYSISKKYGITIEKIKTLNNITTNSISTGSVLFLE